MKEQKIFEPSPPKSQNNVMLVGMPGIALVGKVTVKTIIDQYKAKKVLDLFLDDLPPRIIIDKTGKPTSLSMSLYYAADPDQKRGLFLLIGDIQPQSHKGQYEFADWVCQIAKKFNVGLILSCAAAVTPIYKENPGVHIAGNSFSVVKSFLRCKNVTPFKGGTITGSNGLIPAMAGQQYGIDGGCVLADTTRIIEQVFSYDPLAGKALLKTLTEHLKLSIDTSYLDKDISELRKIIKNLKQTSPRDKDERTDRGQAFIS